MPKTEEQFRIESDARTLVDAELIRADDKRFKSAAAHLQKMNDANKKAMKKT